MLFRLDLKSLHAQIPLSVGDYRTISSGNYDNSAIWEVWDGTTWINASTKPTAGNSIFIDQGHEVRLRQDEEAFHVYLFSAASPGRKLNLQDYELQIFGSLRGMQKTGGVFEINSVSNATIDWIYPETGRIVFKGISRTVVDRSSWSANTINSRYTVVFEADQGETLIINSAFKASKFIIKSGTVYQTVNTSGIPACSTFSFNNQTIFNGNGPYGELIIESGGTLITECSSPLSSFIRRSENVPAGLLRVNPSATLVFLGNEPLADVAEIEFLGNVHYSAASGTQQLLGKTMSTAVTTKNYHTLIFENAAEKNLIDSLFITGDFRVLSGPSPLHNQGYVKLHGTNTQEIDATNPSFYDFHVAKASGEVNLTDHLTVFRHLYMEAGAIDFADFSLNLNESNLGGLQLSDGSWWRINQINYHHIPSSWQPSNATFPLGDRYQGGIRRIRLTGDSPGGNLFLKYNEIPGANWDPNFNDTDGTPILYQLNSYIEISGLSPSLDPIELRISADNLIVDQVEDIRIVSNGVAAPGSNLIAIDSDTLWARRLIPYEELNNQTFTIGSYRVLSILPLTWGKTDAVWENGIVKITWDTFHERNTSHFIIRKAFGNVTKFQEVARVESQGMEANSYVFEFPLRFPDARTFFQLEQVDHDDKSSFSDVFRLDGVAQDYHAPNTIHIHPNPFSSGQLFVEFGRQWILENTYLIVSDTNGIIIFDGPWRQFDCEKQLTQLIKGVYIFHFTDGALQKSVKILKQ